MKIFMIAGEPSGDRLGANLIEGLRLQLAQKGVEIVFQGIGGPLMKERGFISLFDIKDLAVIIVGDLVIKGLVKDCTDTDDETEFEMQDSIVETLCEKFNITNE